MNSATSRHPVSRLLAFTKEWLPTRQDEAIALSRLLLSAVSLVAIYIDPTQPARFVQLTYVIVVAYVMWSVLLALRAFTARGDSRHALAIQASDILIIIVLTYLTDGPSSPFFVFFTFSIVSAGLRWGARGAILTAAIVLVAFLVIAMLAVDPGGDDINRTIVRAAYLVVTGVLIGFFGWHRQQADAQLQRLSEWPLSPPLLSEDPPLARALEHAAMVLDLSRLAVVWKDLAKSGWKVARWTGSDCTFSVWSDASAPLSRGPETGAVSLSPVLSGQLGFRNAVAAAFETPHFQGAVLILDPPRHASELQRLAAIVSRRVALELDQFQLRRDLADAAISRERERLARDMHDGILQDLTAVGLHLEAISRTTPEPQLSTIKGLASLVMEQQARIRSFIDLMNPRMRRSRPVPLSSALQSLMEMLERQWHVRLTSTVDPVDAELTQSQEMHLRSLLGEATANAVRHGGATELRIDAKVGDSIEVRVVDNGHPSASPVVGVPGGALPASLQQRVADLGGSYHFELGEEGSQMFFALPRGF